MKKVIAIAFALAAISCIPSVFAQGNCSYITNFLTSDTKDVGTACDTHFNQAVTETQTYTESDLQGVAANRRIRECVSIPSESGCKRSSWCRQMGLGCISDNQ